MSNRDKHDQRRQNQTYSPYHFTPSPPLSTGSDLLSRSIMQLAETQSRSLEIFAAQQKSQIDVYQELGPTRRRNTMPCSPRSLSLMEIVPSVSNG